MAHRLQNRHDGTPMWWMELDHDATVALCSYGHFKTKAYGLLHDNGSLMRDANGPITAADWATACRLAQMNSTNWLLLYHEQRAVRVVFTEHGAYVEGDTFLQPNVAALPTLQSMTINVDTQEPSDAEPKYETLAPQPALKGKQKPTRRSNRRG